MTFVGIIENNRNIVHEITEYFLAQEDYSLLFICSSLDEYKSLPPGKKNRAGIIISNPGQHHFDQLWHAQYLKQVSREARILFLTDTSMSEHIAHKVKEAGADLFIDRNAVTQDLVEVFGNEVVNDKAEEKREWPAQPAASSPEPSKKVSLTARELEIIDLVAKAYTNKEIAEALFISQYTVNAHLRKIFVKLSVKSRTALVNFIVNRRV